jgi:uncharacterized protein (DUF58 family)
MTQRRIVLTRDSPWFWLVAVLGVGLAITLALLFFALFLGLLAAGLIAAPFLLWRRGRRPRGNVIDVEDYEVTARPPEE